MSQATTAATANTTLIDWVERVAELTKPAAHRRNEASAL